MKNIFVIVRDNGDDFSAVPVLATTDHSKVVDFLRQAPAPTFEHGGQLSLHVFKEDGRKAEFHEWLKLHEEFEKVKSHNGHFPLAIP